MAKADVDYMKTPKAEWTEWTTKNAVKNGYAASGWVYRAVSLISGHISSIPWSVVNSTTGEKLADHPITTLLAHPNPEFSRMDFFELISSWQQLSGEAYIKKVEGADGQTAEIWPISPDRIAPIEGQGSKLIEGYEILNEKGVKVKSSEYTTENTISVRFLDPANPCRGIGPLQVAAKSVDIDLDQLSWNKAAMQNRGVLDGVFTFDRTLDATAYDTVKKKIKELFSGPKNARDIGVIGSNAKYQRLSLTPAEMDFITSRRFNREEIFIIFGIPPQLAGVQDASTYNNYATSMRIFWELTLIPILDDIKDTFNFAFADELDAGTEIGYDVSSIPALKQTHREKGEISRMYHTMGVPVSALNDMFQLGIPEYEGWDISTVTQNEKERGRQNEARSKEESTETRKSMKDTVVELSNMMTVSKDLIDRAINEKEEVRMASVGVALARFKERLGEIAESVIDDPEVRNIFTAEIELSTVTDVSAIVRDGIRERQSPIFMAQAVEDTGIFSENRSIAIAMAMHKNPKQGEL